MKNLILFGFILLLTMGAAPDARPDTTVGASVGAGAHEASLIDEDTIPKKAPEKISMIEANTTNTIINQEMSETEDNFPDDDFEQMHDFIQQENERLKNIKLLNLDVEWANLKLKEKEIEQKIGQLDKALGSMAPSTAGVGMRDKPVMKLLGVFESDAFKKAVVAIDGLRINVQEGEHVNGMLVKSITPQTVVLQWEDGQTQELRFL